MSALPSFGEDGLKSLNLEQSLHGYLDYSPSLAQYSSPGGGFLEFQPSSIGPGQLVRRPLTMALPERSSPPGASSSSDSTVHGASSSQSELSTPIPLSPRTPDATPPKLGALSRWPRTSQSDGLSAFEEASRTSGMARNGPIEGRKDTRQAPNTGSRLRHKPDVDELRRVSNGSRHAEEWDTRPSRNVTVRRTRQALPDRSLPNSSESWSDNGGESRPATAPAVWSPPQTPEMRRLSSGSTTSKIVRANIVVTPPGQQPALRKVSKHDSLRSEASKHSSKGSVGSDSSSSPRSAASPLFHRRNRHSIDSDTSSTNGMPHILKRKMDRSNLRRSITPEDPNLPSTQEAEGLPRVPEELRSLQYDSAYYPEGMVQSHLPQQHTTAIKQTMPGSFPQSAAEAEVNGNRNGGRLLMPYNSSPISVATSAVTSSDVFHDAASHISDQASVETLRGTSNTRSGPYDPNEPATPTGRSKSTNPSITRSDFSKEEIYRFSPMSTRSDATLAYEVKEAAAVNIFAHNNNSLLLVQHGSYDLLRQHEASTTRQALERGLAVTGPGISSHVEDDSSLQNPRTAPVPPIVAVIPPTPAKELDDQESDHEDQPAPGASPPGRPSLWKRYSDTFIHPFTGSVRRRRNGHSLSRSASARRPQNVSAQDETNLHPLWRPRGFWNESSDSEDEDYELEERDASDSRDTRDVPRWRRGASIKGFLIGNSLGLERGPTNRRRPRITLPSMVSGAEPAKVVTVRDSARRSAKGTGAKPRSASISSLLQGWKDRMTMDRKDHKEEMAREGRREQLRSSIRAQVPGNEPVINWAQNSVPGQQEVG